MVLSRKNLKYRILVSPFEPQNCGKGYACEHNHKPCTEENITPGSCPLNPKRIGKGWYLIKQTGKLSSDEENTRLRGCLDNIVHAFPEAYIDLRLYNDGRRAFEVRDPPL